MKPLLYQQLTKYLQSLLPESYRREFYSWIERGRIINQGADVTENSIELIHIRYNAVLYFDEFPYNQISPQELMVLIQGWLNTNDPMRCQLDLYETDFDLEILDDNTADLTFTIDFQEPITAVKNPQGMITVNGEKYALDEIEVNVADDISVQFKP